MDPDQVKRAEAANQRYKDGREQCLTEHGRRTAEGMSKRAKEGYYPGVAPIGYRRNKNGIEPDPKYAPLVAGLFLDFIRLPLTWRDMLWFGRVSGLKTRSGRQLSAVDVDDILTNPIYVGYFVWCGQLCRGRHLPLVSVTNYVKSLNKIRGMNVAAKQVEIGKAILLMEIEVLTNARKLLDW